MYRQNYPTHKVAINLFHGSVFLINLNNYSQAKHLHTNNIARDRDTPKTFSVNIEKTLLGVPVEKTIPAHKAKLIEMKHIKQTFG